MESPDFDIDGLLEGLERFCIGFGNNVGFRVQNFEDAFDSRQSLLKLQVESVHLGDGIIEHEKAQDERSEVPGGDYTMDDEITSINNDRCTC